MSPSEVGAEGGHPKYLARAPFRTYKLSGPNQPFQHTGPVSRFCVVLGLCRRAFCRFLLKSPVKSRFTARRVIIIMLR